MSEKINRPCPEAQEKAKRYLNVPESLRQKNKAGYKRMNREESRLEKSVPSV